MINDIQRIIARREEYRDYQLPNKPFYEVWHGVRRSLRYLDGPRAIVQWYLSRTGVQVPGLLDLFEQSTQIVVPTLKAITTKMKKNSEQYPPTWRYFCELDLLAGYPRFENRIQDDNPTMWLTSQHAKYQTARWWYTQFNKTYSKFRTFKRTMPRLREYITARWLWTTDGAAKGSLLTLDDRPIKTKFGLATSLTDEQLIHLYENSKPEINIFVKADEKGFKKRLIANVPFKTYIVTSYILNYFLNHISLQAPWIGTTDMLIEQQVAIIETMRKGTVLVPLDESKYDYHMMRETWLGFIEFIQTFPDLNEAATEMKEIFEQSFWQFEDQKGKWRKGMPSGLAITTFLNSWCNYIKQINIDTHFNHASGDDALFVDPHHRSLDHISLLYKDKYGSDVNPTKNWISKDECEYLKDIYSKIGIQGYPARVFSSLIWADKDPTVDPLSKLYELSELWKQFYDKLGVPMDEEVVCRDLSLAVRYKLKGFNKNMARKWLHAPPSHGGGGFYPFNDFSFHFKVDEHSVMQYRGAILKLPQIMYSTKWSFSISRFDVFSKRQFRFGKPPKLPDITNLKEWEARLNLEDIPGPKKYRSEYFDLIPLPRLPYISTATMSKFAKKFKMYKYYNYISGSSNIVKLRYLDGCRKLIDIVRSFMYHNRLKYYI